MTAKRQPVPAAFGGNVRAERARQGWTVRQAAVKAGVSPMTVFRAERGLDVALSSAAALAGAYGVPVGALLGEVRP